MEKVEYAGPPKPKLAVPPPLHAMAADIIALNEAFILFFPVGAHRIA
jgi:hypothetical protein